jgi:hypothetical protein
MTQQIEEEQSVGGEAEEQGLDETKIVVLASEAAKEDV